RPQQKKAILTTTTNRQFTTLVLSLAPFLVQQQPTQQQLHELGIDFSTTTLPATAVLDANKNIVLSQGIVFASGANKGEALQLLIQQCSLRSSYKKIVVIDDKLSNIKAIMKAFADDAGITIIGIRYGFVDADVANYNAMRDCVAQVAAEQETVREIAQA
ncbi:DUF2608 domain-containing protein, partial [Candidatus Dependentiae bacterium]|nr:DUF2608 domain-containing protein [Candidatus Dependentiae bacterium]